MSVLVIFGFRKKDSLYLIDLGDLTFKLTLPPAIYVCVYLCMYIYTHMNTIISLILEHTAIFCISFGHVSISFE